MTSRLLAVGFGPGACAPASPALEALATLAADQWRPKGAELRTATAPMLWAGGAAAVQATLSEVAADVVLLVSHDAELAGVLIPSVARNRAHRRPDAAGLAWPGAAIAPGGAPEAEGGVSVAGLTRALQLAGAPLVRSSAGANGPDNRAFYALAAQPDAPPAALMVLPWPIETARRHGMPAACSLNRAEVLAAVQAALLFCAAAGEVTRAARAAAGSPG